MSLGDKILVMAMVSQGGDSELGYDRNQLARKYNAQTCELHKCDVPKPRVVKRQVKELPIWIGI